jgi:hypothetical protein
MGNLKSAGRLVMGQQFGADSTGGYNQHEWLALTLHVFRYGMAFFAFVEL